MPQLSICVRDVRRLVPMVRKAAVGAGPGGWTKRRSARNAGNAFRTKHRELSSKGPSYAHRAQRVGWQTPGVLDQFSL
jgi:hypothetical protein